MERYAGTPKKCRQTMPTYAYLVDSGKAPPLKFNSPLVVQVNSKNILIKCKNSQLLIILKSSLKTLSNFRILLN